MENLNLYDDMAAWYYESVQYDFDCLTEDDGKFSKMFEDYDFMTTVLRDTMPHATAPTDGQLHHALEILKQYGLNARSGRE